MEKVQIGPLISKEAKEMLERMSTEDLRSYGNWLEWLIRREYDRRNTARALVDARPEYHTGAHPQEA